MAVAFPGSPDVFRQLLHQMTEAVSLSDENWRIVYANPAMHQMFGYELGELIGQSAVIQNAYAEAETAARSREMAEAVAETGAFRGEWRNRRKDGSEFFTIAKVSRVEVNGTPHWLCLQEDVTEDRRTREALQESEARLAAAVSTSKIGIWDWDLTTDQFVYSAQAKAIYGFAPDATVTYDMVRDATHPDDLPRTQELSRRARDPADRFAEPFEYRLLRPDGQVRWVVAAGRVRFAETPEGVRPVRYIGTIRDITEERRALEELRQSETRLRLAVDAGRMAVWQASAGAPIISSPRLNRLLGFPEDATPSQEEMNARYAPGELERVQRVATEALARGDPYFEVEFAYDRAPGERVWLLLRAEVQLGPYGTPTEAVGVLIDVTERRQAQQRLELLAREIDHRANNLLTVALATVRLSRAQTAASLREVISGRIDALARAHALIADSKWAGADMRRLVMDELRPFQTDHNIRAQGPDLRISGAAAQSLAMVLHELATNAAKYGALSGQGSVEVEWRTSDEGGLHLLWRERDGPLVSPPRHKGFGSRVIERTVAEQLGGTAELDWRPGGLECRVYIPPTKLSAGEAMGGFAEGP